MGDIQQSQLLARHLLTLSSKRRNEVISYLDTDLKFEVVNHIFRFKEDMPFDLRDTIPTPPVPPCL